MAVEHAIKCGYRLIDTAVCYHNHRAVGRAVKKCIEEGIVKREDLFITTKLWITDWTADSVMKSIKKSLEELQMDYVDLILYHKSYFYNLPEEAEEKRQKGDFHDYDMIVPDDPKYRLGYTVERMKETWTAMEAARDAVQIYHLFLIRAMSAPLVSPPSL